MKREDLKKLELSDEAIDKIMSLHGTDLEKFKTAATNAETESKTVKDQLAEANTAIEGFKKMDVGAIQAAADDYKAKFEQAQKEAAANLSALKFDHALESALSGAKSKNTKAVQALLDKNALKLNDDGSIIGLNEQLEKIKAENDYLFADTKEPPKIVAGGQSHSVVGDPQFDAMRKGAGLSK
jgi:predicted  nucleic acid-binding Zn-ribbon protein